MKSNPSGMIIVTDAQRMGGGGGGMMNHTPNLPSGLSSLPPNFLNNIPPGIRGVRRLGRILDDVTMHDNMRVPILIQRVRGKGIRRLRRILAGSGVPITPFLQSLHPDGPSGIIPYPFPGAPTEEDDV